MRNYKKLFRKAYKLILDDKVEEVEKGWYIVHSKKDHNVDVKRLTCDCNWFALHQTICSHLLAGIISENEKHILNELDKRGVL